MATRLTAVVLLGIVATVCVAAGAYASGALEADEMGVIHGGCVWYCAQTACGVGPPPIGCGGFCPNGPSDCEEDVKEMEFDVFVCASQFATAYGTCDHYDHYEYCGYVFDCCCEGTGEQARCYADRDTEMEGQEIWPMCYIVKLPSDSKCVVARLQ